MSFDTIMQAVGRTDVVAAILEALEDVDEIGHR